MPQRAGLKSKDSNETLCGIFICLIPEGRAEKVSPKALKRQVKYQRCNIKID